MNLNSPFLAYNQDFVLFGGQHLVVIGLMLLLSVGLSIWGRQKANEKARDLVNKVLLVSIAFWAWAYVFILLWLGDFDYKEDLPLVICNLMAVSLPFMMWRPTARVHGIVYFLIFCGTLQAVITPDLLNGFPNFIFIKYWMVHAGLIVYAVYVTVAYRFYPTKRQLWQSFLILQGYVLAMFLVNALLDSNYFYVMHKPRIASALDYLGPWPVYLLVCEALVLGLYFLAFLPVMRHSRVKGDN